MFRLLLAVGLVVLVGCSRRNAPTQTEPEQETPAVVVIRPDATPPKKDEPKFDQFAENRVASFVTTWGGSVTRDDAAPGKPILTADLTDLKVPLSDDDFQYLGKLSAITWLELKRQQQLSKSKLANVGKLKTLTTLGLSNTELTDANLKDIANLTNLTSLDLSKNSISDAGLKELSPLVKLQSLDLSHTHITDAGLKNLAPLTNLTSLDLGGTHTTDAGLKALAPLKKLTTLNMNIEASDDTLAALREANLLHVLPLATTADGSRPTKHDEIQRLNLRFTQVTGKGLKELASLGNLTHLDLTFTGVNDAGLKELATFKNLNSLVLTELSVTDRTLATLREMNLLHAFKGALGPKGQRPNDPDDVVSFDLRGTKAADAGVKELTIFKNLTTLNLAFTEVTDDGLKELPAFKNLTTLYLGSSKVTGPGAEALRVLLPNCKIVR